MKVPHNSSFSFFITDKKFKKNNEKNEGVIDIRWIP